MSYVNIERCRACGSITLIPVFDLGLQPPANEFKKKDEARLGFFPLKVLSCQRCTLAQLSIVIDPKLLYRDYKYTTSTSQTMQRHFERLFGDLGSETSGRTIVEVGSNDGLCLNFAHIKGYTGVGIDPAINLATVAEQTPGITTIREFFDRESAQAAKQIIGTPAVILTRHCFAHIGDWKESVASLEVLAGKDTVIALEIPYVHDTLAKCEFDQVYHEHLSYISVTALVRLLRGTPFHIHRVIRYGIHGGSLLVMLRHKDSGVEPHLSADEYLAEDAVTLSHWKQFDTMAMCKINTMRETVRDRVSKGKRVVGFGASAKATVWINACGFTKDDLLFVSDNSIFKPGCLVPGTDIRVIEQDELLGEHPDYAVLFAWNYEAEILQSQRKWLERGGQFIVPTVNGVKIVGKKEALVVV